MMRRQRRSEEPCDVEANSDGPYRATTSMRSANDCERRFPPLDHKKNDRNTTVKRRRIRILCMFGPLLMLVCILLFAVTQSETKGPIHFSCPDSVEKSANDIPSENAEYRRVTNRIKTNLTEYMQTFRNSSFDLWGRTYDTIKKGMYHWKSTRFAPYLENGSTIYESACGIGMNLYMTLEIMNEVKGIESLIVYGSEYVDLSVQVANAVFDDSVPFKARKGTICPGDSAHLDFVPSNSFDLVYTGYITPINDPLHLNKGDVNENIKLYREACKGKDWQSIKLNELAQRTQEDFYGRWVEEMTRIAKPDKPVIIEQVSMPVCDEVFDWGGVAKEWWNNVSTHSRYGWDVDPNSIEMEKDTIYRNRYHVFMRKSRLT